MREELFAPVLAVQTFTEESEALEIAGDAELVLAAAAWTNDLGRPTALPGRYARARSG